MTPSKKHFRPGRIAGRTGHKRRRKMRSGFFKDSVNVARLVPDFASTPAFTLLTTLSKPAPWPRFNRPHASVMSLLFVMSLLPLSSQLLEYMCCRVLLLIRVIRSCVPWVYWSSLSLTLTHTHSLIFLRVTRLCLLSLLFLGFRDNSVVLSSLRIICISTRTA